ncbi:M81 family metallopeptidase [Vreelandella maris]|uniref:M81 family metallopeptidase n=1 Tax=Vreelandella maris TaxID=2729617 RepID=A0A7Y6RGC5_9GAMM|nr:M81 family metallopeptidase [Halomonas maris]NVF16532.1 M81 family metallopeptidase [Halomonas maris]|tara:strand:- start:14071 stop:15195 length:1125 start_codon:yes stop_codon:yes gene_type:complete
MHRILIAGFQHETNTFAPTVADYTNFACGESFPPLCRGDDLLELRDVNMPLGGFLSAFEPSEATFLPVIWAGASPSAHVTQETYERIAGEIVDATRHGGFDAIYLDLHGAMVAEHLDDCEGELLRRIRDVVGASMPIVVSLDLHANVTEGMLEAADLLTAYREYPHTDMAATGARAANLLRRLLATRDGWHTLHYPLPFLIPVNSGCTWLEPAKGTYEYLAQLEQGHDLELSFAPGFPMADFPGCRPCVWGYGRDQAALALALERLYAHILHQESAWKVETLAPEEAVSEAIRLAAFHQQPVVIADTQDNPGAGGDGNTMGMLKALYAANAVNAAIGLIWDPEVVASAHAAGEGAEIELSLGGRSGVGTPATII